MDIPDGYVTIEGSERTIPEADTRIYEADNDTITLNVRLAAARDLPGPGERISYEDLKDYEVSREDMASITGYLVDRGFKLISANATSRTILASAPCSAVEAAFVVDLAYYQTPSGSTYRGHSGAVYVPSELSTIVQSVSGIDTMSQVSNSMPVTVGSRKYVLPNEILKYYNVPADVDGSGQTVGVIGFEGGFALDVLQGYWQSLGITNLPSVTVKAQTGWSNNLNDGLWTAELHMDIGVVGAFAPGANIVVYAAPGDPLGFAGYMAAFSQAIHDTVSRPSVLTTSIAFWLLSASDRAAMEADLALAASLGITVVAASGDWGSTYFERPDHNIVFNPQQPDAPSYPQESPNVLVVGGTTMTTSADGSQLLGESIWYTGTSTSGTGYGSGTGVSDTYAKPSWQTPSNIPHHATDGFVGRAFPDCSGIGDNIWGRYPDGTYGGYGGTSATAPMFAAMIARMNQKLGTKIGFLNSALYSHTWALRAVTNTLDTGHYPVTNTGWEPGIGLGVPNFGLLLEVLHPGLQTLGTAKSKRFSTGIANARIVGRINTQASAHVVSRGFASTRGIVYPPMSMDDFGAWQPGAPDSAMARWIGSMQTGGREEGWNRIWVASTSPTELRADNGNGDVIWPRGYYAGAGVKYPAVATGTMGMHSHAQLEKWYTNLDIPTTTLSGSLPQLFSDDPNGVLSTINVASVPGFWPDPPFYLVINRDLTDQELMYVQTINGTALTGRRGTASPMPAHSSGASLSIAEITTYEAARTIYIDMRGDRINYVKNPSFETSLAFVGGSGLSFNQTASVQPEHGTQSLTVTALGSGMDAYAVELLELNKSLEYAWSCFVFSPVGSWLDMSRMGLQEVTDMGTLGRTIGSGTNIIPIPAQEWTRVWGTGRVPANWGPETVFRMLPASLSDGSGWDTAVPFYYDSLQVEDGPEISDYFDGSFPGEDYLWENDGSGISHPHESRSYHYQGLHEKAYRVDRTVQDWIPFGSNYKIRYGYSPLT